MTRNVYICRKVCWHRKEENYKAISLNTRREGRKDLNVNQENMEKKKSSNSIGKSVTIKNMHLQS